MSRVAVTLKFVASISWGFEMSTYQQRPTAAMKRLSFLVDDTVNLNRQLCELKELRDRVRQAEVSARESRRTDNRKSRRKDEIQGQLAF